MVPLKPVVPWDPSLLGLRNSGLGSLGYFQVPSLSESPGLLKLIGSLLFLVFYLQVALGEKTDLRKPVMERSSQ